MKTFLPNTDIPVGMTCKDVNGPISFPGLHDYHVYVYNMAGHKKNVIKVFKKADTGLTKITVDPDVNGRITFIISRKFNRNLSNTTLFAEIFTQADATDDFDEELRNDGVTGIGLCMIGVAANSTEMI